MKSIFVISVFAFGTLFAEESGFYPLEKQEKASTKFSVVPYVQTYYIFPGAGISFRGQNEYWGVQLDANMANTSLFGTSYDYEVSVSALCSPFERKEWGWLVGGLYLSAGVGAHLNTPGTYGLQPCSPLFVGYQGKWINISAGIDLIYWIPYSKYYERYMFFVTDAAPSVKLGISF